MPDELNCILQTIKKDLKPSYRRNWLYAVPDFTAKLSHTFHPENILSGECLWKSGNAAIRKIDLPPELGGQSVILKPVLPVNVIRHIMLPSPAMRDAINLLLLEKLGFDTVRLLCLREERSLFILKRSYLVTEFAAGFRDGREFIAGGSLVATPLQEEFIKGALEILAKLHDWRLYHGGYRVYNILWRKEEDQPMKFKLLDLPTMFRVPAIFFDRCMTADLMALFMSLEADFPAIERYAAYYWSLRCDKLNYSQEEFCQKMRKTIRQRHITLERKHTGLRKKWREFKKKIRHRHR